MPTSTGSPSSFISSFRPASPTISRAARSAAVRPESAVAVAACVFYWAQNHLRPVGGNISALKQLWLAAAVLLWGVLPVLIAALRHDEGGRYHYTADCALTVLHNMGADAKPALPALRAQGIASSLLDAAIATPARPSINPR